MIGVLLFGWVALIAVAYFCVLFFLKRTDML